MRTEEQSNRGINYPEAHANVKLSYDAMLLPVDELFTHASSAVWNTSH